MGKSYSKVSVIIPAYNSQATISACLGAVIPQAVACGAEIIVVDSSSDNTPQMIARDFPLVRLVHLDDRTFPSDARNHGIQLSDADILCFTDSDCIPQRGWLEGMIGEIRADKARVVCGGVLPANPESITGLTLFLLEFRPFHHRMPARDVTSFVTCNVAMTRDVFNRYGPFDPIWPGEDTLLAERIRAGGEKIIFRPEHKVAHINRSGWRAVLTHSKLLGWVTAQAMDMSPTLPTRYWLERAWLLCAVVPVIMPIRVVVDLGIAAPSTVLSTLPIAPLMIGNYLAWNIGFLKYCWRRRNVQ